MNRQQRRATASETRKQAAPWSPNLTEIPQSQWPPRSPGQTEYPEAVWRSRYFLVQRYAAPELHLPPDSHAVTVKRLSVNRVTTGKDGDWEQNITWDELQAIKREIGHGDSYAVEVYPRDRDIVNVANMRHLWLFEKPLAIGWGAEAGAHLDGAALVQGILPRGPQGGAGAAATICRHDPST